MPNTSVTIKKPTPATVARYRTTFARSKSRSDQPMTRNVTTPSAMAASCFMVSPGFTVAMAAMPMVHRKKAIVSTSKDFRRIMQ